MRQQILVSLGNLHEISLAVEDKARGICIPLHEYNKRLNSYNTLCKYNKEVANKGLSALYNNSLIPSFVVKESSIKSLPTKAVLVQGKNPHIRTQQHFNPDKAQHNPRPASSDKLKPANKSSVDVDSLIDKINEGRNINYKGLNNFLNTHESDDPRQTSELFDAIAGSLYSSEMMEKGHTVSTGIRGLDLHHNIAGTSVAGHLLRSFRSMDVEEDMSHVIDHLAYGGPEPTHESSSRDKDLGFEKISRTVQMMPHDKRNSYIDNQLSKFVDQKYTEYVLKSDLFSQFGLPDSGLSGKQLDKQLLMNRIELHDKPYSTTRLNTVMDFVLEKHGADKVGQVYNKLNAEYPKNVQNVIKKYMVGDGTDMSNSLSWRMLGASKDPKEMNSFMELTGNVPTELAGSSVQDHTGHLINGWMKGNSHGLGLLMRRSIEGATGFRSNQEGGRFFTEKHESLYSYDELPITKIPPKVAKALKNLKHISADMLSAHKSGKINLFNHEGDTSGILYRGLTFKGAKASDTIHLRDTMGSASRRKSVAEQFIESDAGLFARLGDKNVEDIGLYFSETLKKYIVDATMYKDPDNVSKYGNVLDTSNHPACMLAYDGKKLMEDNKVFTVISEESLRYMNQKHNIPMPSELGVTGDEYEFIFNT